MKALRLIAIVLIAVLAYPSWLAFQIWQQSHRDEVRSADAIVVLGAAQYDGEPSPVFRARLEHGRYLYGEGLADRLIITGGKQPGDRFTEAEAGEHYLIERDVPEEVIVREATGRTTLQSLREVRELARTSDIDTLLLVSDPMHSERIKRIANDLGFDAAYTSPASYVELSRSRVTKARELVREVASLMAYEILNR